MDGRPLELEARVLAVLARWDRRLEAATAAWAGLSDAEQQRREAELDEVGETDEWVIVLWNWWHAASTADQEQLRSDVAVLAGALRAAADDGHLGGPSGEAAAARHLLRALDRMALVLGRSTCLP